MGLWADLFRRAARDEGALLAPGEELPHGGRASLSSSRAFAPGVEQRTAGAEQHRLRGQAHGRPDLHQLLMRVRRHPEPARAAVRSRRQLRGGLC